MTVEITATPPASGAGECGREHLAELLARAAHGDVDAFMRFYDAGSAIAYRWALARTRDPAVAAEETVELYRSAWARAGDQASSGLSPLAWLLVPAPRRLHNAAP